jgi:hypothetical protein
MLVLILVSKRTLSMPESRKGGKQRGISCWNLTLVLQHVLYL